MLPTDDRNKPWNLCKKAFNKKTKKEIRTIFENCYNKVKLNTVFSNIDFEDFPDKILFEYWFRDKQHFNIGTKEKIYYQFKELIPYKIRTLLRNKYVKKQKLRSKLNWPIESLYVSFLHNLLKEIEKTNKIKIFPLNLWPKNYKCAFVITHDVEGIEGLKKSHILMEIEESLGFKSMFNLVPYKYKITNEFISSARKKGFDVGLHGIKHDGKLLWSYKGFKIRAKKANDLLRNFDLHGFRAPLTLRNPEWFQLLDIDFDMSFFDTDPFEPLPGGTMSIYPFFMKNFLELPYTLPQDNSIFNIMRKRNLEIWKKKINFIEKFNGMILVNIHPDYINENNNWGINTYPLSLYEEFLIYAKNKNYWFCLPRDVVSWWKKTKS